MSDDIYKNRERMPVANTKPPKRRKRRVNSKMPFDERDRKRRSRNSGFRRLLHLSRKKENEKFFWWSMLSVALIMLIIIAVWQFIIREVKIRESEKMDDYREEVDMQQRLR